MDLDLLAVFAIASLVMAVIPGPGVATIVGFAFSSGRLVALASVAGMALGNALAMSISLAGAGAVLASSAIAFAVLKWAGATYLIVLGLLAIARSRQSASADGVGRAIAPRTAFITTVAVGTFHPKTIIFFIAFATQFIDPSRPYVPQAAILVATFTVIAAITDSAYALLASSATKLFDRGRFRLWARQAGGGVLVAAGVATAAIRR